MHRWQQYSTLLVTVMVTHLYSLYTHQIHCTFSKTSVTDQDRFDDQLLLAVCQHHHLPPTHEIPFGVSWHLGLLLTQWQINVSGLQPLITTS